LPAMWGTIFLLATPILGSLLFIYVMLFGQSEYHRRGIVGYIHYFISYIIPDVSERIALKVLGRANVNRIKGLGDYLMNQSHPLLQIFYLFLVTAGATVYISQGWERIAAGGKYVHPIHAITSPLMILFTYFCFYIACVSNPGKVNKDNVKEIQKRYPYDGLLFLRKECPTCKLEKPARSKHCSLCKACVSRFDHHCAWINNCVGENNLKYFWNFLFVTSMLCFYVSYILFMLFLQIIDEKNLYNLRLIDPSTKQRIKVDNFHVMMYILNTDLMLAMLLMFLVLCGSILLIFLMYHVYLVSVGTTSNESFKWEDIRDRLREEGQLVVTEDYHPFVNGSDESSSSSSGGNAAGGSKRKKKKESTQDRIITEPNQIRNIYNKGVLSNIKEALFPYS